MYYLTPPTSFLCHFYYFLFFPKNYLLLSCATSVRPSVRLSVRPSVEMISFRGNSLSNRPIDLKIGLNVREGVLHVRKARFFDIRIASCNFFAIYVAIHANFERYCRISRQRTLRVSTYTSTCGQTYCAL